MDQFSIEDLISQCEVAPTPKAINAILDILLALCRRIDAIEAEQRRTANIASCLANGMKPD
jgi:hypothetical protein